MENYKAAFYKDIPKPNPKTIKVLYNSNIERAAKEVKNKNEEEKLQNKFYSQITSKLDAPLENG